MARRLFETQRDADREHKRGHQKLWPRDAPKRTLFQRLIDEYQANINQDGHFMDREPRNWKGTSRSVVSCVVVGFSCSR